MSSNSLEEDEKMLILKLKMNHALGLRSRINIDQMNMLKEKDLIQNEFMKNVEVYNMNSKFDYDVHMN